MKCWYSLGLRFWHKSILANMEWHKTQCSLRRDCLVWRSERGYLWKRSINENHYENTPIQIFWILQPKERKIFRKKNLIFFHISAQNIDCGYSLEPPYWGNINVGFKGKNYIGVFLWWLVGRFFSLLQHLLQVRL